MQMSGGVSKSKRGTLKKRQSLRFSKYKEQFVQIDGGDIMFATDEDQAYDMNGSSKR